MRWVSRICYGDGRKKDGKLIGICIKRFGFFNIC